MNKIKKIFNKPKLIYKTLMCMCICILCFLTILITEGGQQNASVTNESVTQMETAVVQEEKIDEIVENLSEQSTAKLPDEEMVTSPAAAELSFSPPVYGVIQKPFSPENVLYSQTMDDWRIHLGVDICAPVGTDITAAEGGMVTYCGYDINLGYVVKIQSGEYECVYASLDSKIPVEVNDTVSRGQIIGVLSDSCISEICDEPHLHFEMTKNGEYVNPCEYVNLDN